MISTFISIVVAATTVITLLYNMYKDAKASIKGKKKKCYGDSYDISFKIFVRMIVSPIIIFVISFITYICTFLILGASKKEAFNISTEISNEVISSLSLIFFYALYMITYVEGFIKSNVEYRLFLLPFSKDYKKIKCYKRITRLSLYSINSIILMLCVANFLTLSTNGRITINIIMQITVIIVCPIMIIGILYIETHFCDNNMITEYSILTIYMQDGELIENIDEKNLSYNVARAQYTVTDGRNTVAVIDKSAVKKIIYDTKYQCKNIGTMEKKRQTRGKRIKNRVRYLTVSKLSNMR